MNMCAKTLLLQAEKHAMESVVYRTKIASKDTRTLCHVIAEFSGLSKSRVKGAMNKGAVWIRRSTGKKRRIRRATAPVHYGDTVWLYYDPRILAQTPPTAQCLKDCVDYSIWFKPAGLMSQGSRFGDHCALTRQAMDGFQPKRPVLLVHRLDREVTGLIILAHARDAAARFSTLLRRNEIEKHYQARVRGDLRHRALRGVIDFPLDSREAATVYEWREYDETGDFSTVRIQIETGRRHQIRRHFDMIGHPVMGDPRYGHGNSCAAGLQLVAYALGFDCPFGGGRVEVAINPDGSGPC